MYLTINKCEFEEYPKKAKLKKRETRYFQKENTDESGVHHDKKHLFEIPDLTEEKKPILANSIKPPAKEETEVSKTEEDTIDSWYINHI
jgi:hypothetical protein